jgi:hypothetical protein
LIDVDIQTAGGHLSAAVPNEQPLESVTMEQYRLDRRRSR